MGKAAWASIVMDPNGHGEDGGTLWEIAADRSWFDPCASRWE